MQYNESLIHDPVPRALTRFAIPLMLANLLQILYSTVDLWIVGRYASTADISAISTASMLTLVITITIAGLVTGMTVLVGQYAGARKPEEMSRIAGSGTVLFALFGLVIMLPLLFFCKPVVSLLNAPAEAVVPTQRYLFICSCGIPFIVGYNIVTGILRGIGDSRAPLICVIVSSVINVVADYILVRYAGLGAAGAALATTGSQCVSFVVALIYLVCFKKNSFHLYRRDVRLDKSSCGQIAKIGVPIALQEFLVNMSFVLITRVINDFGVAASAAGGIAEKVINIACMPTIAYSSAVSTMSAQNIGAGHPERARQSMWVGIRICFVITTLFCIFCFFRGDLLIKLFTKDADVIENGRLYIKFYCMDQMGLAFVFVMNGYFNACGHSLFTMLHSLITTFCLRVPLTIMLGKMPWATMLHIGIPAPLSSLASILICLVYLRHLNRKKGSDPASSLSA